MAIRHSRRRFVAGTMLFACFAVANAQFGGRQHDRTDARSSHDAGPSDATARAAKAPLDAVTAIEHELPSLRIDLRLTADQAPSFNSFEREIRDAAEAGRRRNQHLAAFRVDDGSAVGADLVLGTIADDDAQRAEATRLALDQMKALYAALTPEQRTQFDERIIQSLREPLGGS